MPNYSPEAYKLAYEPGTEESLKYYWQEKHSGDWSKRANGWEKKIY